MKHRIGNSSGQIHHYSFGLKIAAISSRKLPDANEGNIKNNNLYNDKELFDDGDLNWYDYGFRNYDPQIGRFPQLDPLADGYPYYSPFQFAGGEPIGNVDLDGLEPESVVNAVTRFVAQGLTSVTIDVAKTGVNAGKWVVTGFKDGVAFAKVINTTGKLLANLKIAAQALGVASSTVGVMNHALQAFQLSGDLKSHFGIPNQQRAALNNLGRAKDAIMNDWHPIDPQMIPYYHLPEGGMVNWSTGQIRPNQTSIEMTDGPETWIPMFLSGIGEGKLATKGVTEALEEGATKTGMNMIPEGKLANHLFKGAGKLTDNPANRALISKISNGKPLGIDVYGKTWYIGVDAGGRSIYSYTQNGIIKGSGYMTMSPKEMIIKYGLK